MKFILFLVGLVVCGLAMANPPIKLVVGNGPGASLDIVARASAEALGNALVVNKPGAASIAAHMEAKNAPADGRTLVLSTSTPYYMNQYMYKTMPYDVKDFVPVHSYGFLYFAIAARPDFPANNMLELVALARKNPGKLTWGTGSYRAGPHIGGATLVNVLGLDLVHIPFRQFSQMLPELLTGRVDFTIDGATSLTPLVESGKMKYLAFFSPTPSRKFPSVSLTREADPRLAILAWFMILARADTPSDTLHDLHRTLNGALRTPTVLSRIANMDLVGGGESWADMKKLHISEARRWKEIADMAKLAAED